MGPHAGGALTGEEHTSRAAYERHEKGDLRHIIVCEPDEVKGSGQQDVNRGRAGDRNGQDTLLASRARRWQFKNTPGFLIIIVVLLLRSEGVLGNERNERV